MKRVVFSSYDDLQNPYYGGGGALVIHQVAKRLVNDFIVTVYTGSYPGAKNQVIDQVNYKRVGFSWVGPYMGQLFFPFFLLPHVLFDRFDVWLESFIPPWSASLLPLFTKKPLIGITQFFDADAKSKQYRLPFDLVEKLNIRAYKYVIALTKQIQEKILRVHPNIQTFVIPNGVDFPRNKKNKNNVKDYILFIGRLEVNQKGLDLLLNAFAKASLFIPDRLVIAGTGQDNEVEYIKNKIKKFDIEKKVVLVGKVTGKQKETLFTNAKFVVIPSRYESLCIVGLEALAYGKPVVSFDVSGLRWMPRSVAFKAAPFSESEYIQYLILLSKNKNARQRMSNKAIQISKKYSWDKVTELYKRAIILVCEK